LTLKLLAAAPAVSLTGHWLKTFGTVTKAGVSAFDGYDGVNPEGLLTRKKC
jgi:hypothetical protein